MKAITTKFFGPTNVRGSRIKASDSDGNSVMVSYDHASIDPHKAAAVALCRKMDWTGVLVEGALDSGNVYVFLTDNNRIDLAEDTRDLIALGKER